MGAYLITTGRRNTNLHFLLVGVFVIIAIIIYRLSIKVDRNVLEIR